MQNNQLIQTLASEPIINQAYAWLCQQRKNYCDSNNVWHLRFHWHTIKPQLQQALIDGSYAFSPLQEYRFINETKRVWSALDSLVLKAMALVLQQALRLEISPACTHIRGNGGSHEAVRQVRYELPLHDFFIRTDVKSYYASIDHDILYAQCRNLIEDKVILKLIWDYLHNVYTYGGLYWDMTKGISLGCPLSPLMAALYLKPLDDVMNTLRVKYVRFMDDWCILTKTRWQLKRAIKVMNAILEKLKLVKHPDKTEMGKIDKGFTFLGFMFSREVITVASQTVEKAAIKITRLLEQGAAQACIERYLRRWVGWVSGYDVGTEGLEHSRRGSKTGAGGSPPHSGGSITHSRI